METPVVVVAPVMPPHRTEGEHTRRCQARTHAARSFGAAPGATEGFGAPAGGVDLPDVGVQGTPGNQFTRHEISGMWRLHESDQRQHDVRMESIFGEELLGDDVLRPRKVDVPTPRAQELQNMAEAGWAHALCTLDPSAPAARPEVLSTELRQAALSALAAQQRSAPPRATDAPTNAAKDEPAAAECTAWDELTALRVARLRAAQVPHAAAAIAAAAEVAQLEAQCSAARDSAPPWPAPVAEAPSGVPPPLASTVEVSLAAEPAASPAEEGAARLKVVAALPPSAAAAPEGKEGPEGEVQGQKTGPVALRLALALLRTALAPPAGDGSGDGGGGVSAAVAARLPALQAAVAALREGAAPFDLCEAAGPCWVESATRARKAMPPPPPLPPPQQIDMAAPFYRHRMGRARPRTQPLRQGGTRTPTRSAPRAAAAAAVAALRAHPRLPRLPTIRARRPPRLPRRRQF